MTGRQALDAWLDQADALLADTQPAGPAPADDDNAEGKQE